MRAVVLVGGFGTRLRPLTETRPKQMLPIVNRPMIERVIDHLALHGVDQAVLAMGYRPDAFVDAYPNGRCRGVAIQYAIESEPLDTAGAIGFAAREAGIAERFVVVNGDVLTDLDLGALIAFHDDHHGEGTIALHQVEDPSAFGVVPTDEDGCVRAFVEKPPREEAPTDLINAGTYVLEPSVLDRIATDRKVSIEREVFPAMVADRALFAMSGNTYWIDTGTHAKYLSAQMDRLDGVRGVAESGIDPSVRIDPGASIERSVVGPGAQVGEGASVRNSVLLAGAVVGPGAVIDGSVVGAEAVVGAGAKITGLTVMGDRAVVDPDGVLSGEILDVGERRQMEQNTEA